MTSVKPDRQRIVDLEARVADLEDEVNRVWRILTVAEAEGDLAFTPGERQLSVRLDCRGARW